MSIDAVDQRNEQYSLEKATQYIEATLDRHRQLIDYTGGEETPDGGAFCILVEGDPDRLRGAVWVPEKYDNRDEWASEGHSLCDEYEQVRQEWLHEQESMREDLATFVAAAIERTENMDSGQLKGYLQAKAEDWEDRVARYTDSVQRLQQAEQTAYEKIEQKLHNKVSKRVRDSTTTYWADHDEIEPSLSNPDLYKETRENDRLADGGVLIGTNGRFAEKTVILPQLDSRRTFEGTKERSAYEMGRAPLYDENGELIRMRTFTLSSENGSIHRWGPAPEDDEEYPLGLEAPDYPSEWSDISDPVAELAEEAVSD